MTFIILIEEKDGWSSRRPRWRCIRSEIGLEAKSIVHVIPGLCGTHNDKDTKEQEKQNDEQTEDGMKLLPLMPKAPPQNQEVNAICYIKLSRQRKTLHTLAQALRQSEQGDV